jgi:cell division protein YceG involved in septum cleavage
MKAKLLISFATGLLVATGILGAMYYLDPSEVSGKQIINHPSNEEMKNSLTSAGFVILTGEEHAEITAKEVNPEPEEKDVGTVIYRTYLNVSSGMTSIDVGKALEQAHIIDKAMTFFNEVEKRGLSNKLRPGTYELDSQMTMDQVMKVIFK